MIIFGDRSTANEYNDIWRFSMQSMEWTTDPAHAKATAPSVRSEATVMHTKTVFCYLETPRMLLQLSPRYTTTSGATIWSIVCGLKSSLLIVSLHHHERPTRLDYDGQDRLALHAGLQCS